MKYCSKLTPILFLFITLTTLGGCSVNRATGGITPGVELEKAATYYVVKHENDDRGVNTIIASQLGERGFNVSTGPSDKIPDETFAKVTYLDRWMWDITMYMLELTLTISEVKTDFTLANANSYHTSLTRKSPEAMVQETLDNILKGH